VSEEERPPARIDLAARGDVRAKGQLDEQVRMLGDEAPDDVRPRGHTGVGPQDPDVGRDPQKDRDGLHVAMVVQEQAMLAGESATWRTTAERASSPERWNSPMPR
jgi:hypothetical protein